MFVMANLLVGCLVDGLWRRSISLIGGVAWSESRRTAPVSGENPWYQAIAVPSLAGASPLIALAAQHCRLRPTMTRTPDLIGVHSKMGRAWRDSLAQDHKVMPLEHNMGAIRALLHSSMGLLLVVPSLWGQGCRVNNPEFSLGEGTRPGPKPATDTDGWPTRGTGTGATEEASASAHNNMGTSSSDDPGESSLQGSTTGTSSIQISSETGEDSGSQTSASTSTTSTTAVTIVPPNCGDGPALCYLVDDKEVGPTIREARGTGLDLAITPSTGTFETASLPWFSEPVKVLRSAQDAIIAASSQSWPPPTDAIAFDLYVRFDASSIAPQVIFGIRGRLVLVKETDGAVYCKYNQLDSTSETSYVYTSGWSNPEHDTWARVVCAYDGNAPRFWVNKTHIGPIKPTTGVTGKSYPIELGGNPTTLTQGEASIYRGLHASIGGIRIWTDMDALLRDLQI